MIVQNHKRPIQIPQKFYNTLVLNLLRENHCAFNVQLRGFKTDRSVQAELQRNPTILTRLKNALGINHSHVQQDLKPPLNPTNMEKLKQMLGNEESLTDSEKQRIKVAFAEGYLLGNKSNTKGSKTQKYFKLFSQGITVFIFLAIIMSLMASASGSVFR